MSIIGDIARAAATEAGLELLQGALEKLPQLVDIIRRGLDGADDDPIAGRVREMLPARSKSEAASEEIRRRKAADGDGA